MLADELVLDEITTSKISIYIGYEYSQHKGAEWRSEVCLCYHKYSIRGDLRLLDSIGFHCFWYVYFCKL